MTVLFRLEILWRLWKELSKEAVPSGVIHYQCVTRHGIPQATILVAHGREAWRVADFAASVYRRAI
jgi:hypothetical protein